MALKYFKKIRTKSDTADDDSPLTTSPPTTEIYKIPIKRPYFEGNQPYTGLRLFVEFDGGTNPSATVTVWGSSNEGWVKLATLVGVENRQLYQLADIDDAEIWVQLTNIAGTPTNTYVYVEPM